MGGLTLPQPYYDDGQVTIYHGDCREILPELERVDAIVTDPPYGLEFMGHEWDRKWAISSKSEVAIAGKNMALPVHRDNRNANCRRCGGRQRGGNKCQCDRPEWDRPPVEDARDYQKWFTSIAWELYDAIKPGAHLAAFGGTRMFHRMAVAVEEAGFDIRDTLMWMYGSGFPKNKSLMKPGYEPIILARKPGVSSTLNIDDCRLPGDRWPANVMLDDDAAAGLDDRHRRYFYVAKASRKERGPNNDHPTVKPLDLMRWLVSLVAPKTGTVLDPFMGSGTTLLAASQVGIPAIGIEIEERYCEIAVKRLAQSVLPLEIA